MKVLNGTLLCISICLLIGGFFISIVASFYAITEGWGMSILAVLATICILNLLLSAFIKIKHKGNNYNKNITIITIVISLIVLLLTMRSMVGVNQQIELYHTIKNFSNTI